MTTAEKYGLNLVSNICHLPQLDTIYYNLQSTIW